MRWISNALSIQLYTITFWSITACSLQAMRTESLHFQNSANFSHVVNNSNTLLNGLSIVLYLQTGSLHCYKTAAKQKLI